MPIRTGQLYRTSMRPRKIAYYVALASAAISLVAACGSSGSSGSSRGNSSGASGGSSSTVTIGGILTLSGPSAQYSLASVAGAQEAISEINAKGGVVVDGVKHKLAWTDLDDKGVPNQGVADLIKLDGEGVHFLIGAGFASVSTALIADLDRTSALITVPLGLVPESLLAQHPGAFQTQLSPEVQAAAAAWFFNQEHWKSISMIDDSTSTFNATVYPAALKVAVQKYGIKINTIIATQGPSQTDYSSALLALNNSHPDAVVASQTGAANALMVKQARQNGYTWPWYSTSGAPTLEAGIAGKSINGTYDIVGMNLPAMVKSGVPQAIQLNSKYEQANKGQAQQDPGGGYTNAYSAVYAYADAMEIAGTTSDKSELDAAMLKVKLSAMPAISQAAYVAQGTDGTLFDPNHAVVTRAVILRWTGNLPVKYVVYTGE